MAVKTIVFGPTGNIASVAARTAKENGAEVALAMRDPSKTIPGLSSEEEKAGDYTRVQADLTKPETVKAAIEKTGAKHAFVYAAHGSKDAMKSTFEAMKSGGVEFVVFLSSFTISEPKEDVPPEEIIPYIHATVEVSLDQVYGESNYVAVRPGGFATNVLRWSPQVKTGEVKVYGPSFAMDCITPGDMGRVSGIILAKGIQYNQRKVYLYGPKPLSQKEMAEVISKAIGTNVKVTGSTPEEATQQFQAAGVPMPVINYMIKRLGDNEAEQAPRPRYEEGVANVKKYTGQEAESFEHWVSDNKELFV
ncbi:Nitrogen metabolite regulation-like protein bik4 [Pseudocercospora fuligena]|uniref:Nitrogen metabolite regulation-like protein bik4 n=1 Tax=Pseudocercospora fuligena TaxID=685502 RepID=A0A8H6VDR2_9PEZI|nr:Nitrogen metabolite regulation-like protein bik4 [Pseudocercospora fuligena]